MNRSSKKVEKAYEFAKNAYGEAEDVMSEREAIFNFCRSENEKIVALLAEVLNLGRCTEKDLYFEFGPTVRDAVVALSEVGSADSRELLLRTKANPIARAVKVAEIKVNLEHERIDRDSYQRAIDELFS